MPYLSWPYFDSYLILYRGRLDILPIVWLGVTSGPNPMPVEGTLLIKESDSSHGLTKSPSEGPSPEPASDGTQV